MPSRRFSNYARQPQSVEATRTFSLRDFPSGQDCNPSTHFSPARPKIAASTPTSSRGSVATTRRHSFITQHAPPLTHSNNAHGSGTRPLHSSSNTPITASSRSRSSSCSATMRNSTRPTTVKRWAGLTRTTSDWDGLRRDPELLFDNGDCHVHLYARGQSRRGASFRVPFEVLRSTNCGAMFSLCFAQISPLPGSDPKSARRLSSAFTTQLSKTHTVELYIPAPDDASREAAFQWHITTRNFFAFTFGKPLVGSHLGQSLVDLQERLHLFRSGQVDNHQEFLTYIEDQGYRDLVDCPDYALATLYYAEHYRLRDMWIDAFAHCVGMNDGLVLSTEFEPISRLTKALVTRAYLEMDIHLSRVTCALRNFLEDDLSSAFLGLTDGARAHLDRFRTFLHSFYVEKFGYWPPPKGSSFSKALYKSMYFDFKNMHDYLVDLESTADISTQKPASGGICVLQNVDLFDRRHHFIPLPHPLPLLPLHMSLTRRTQSQKKLRTLTLGSKQSKTDRYTTARAALTEATNSGDPSLVNSPIIQTYMRFERQCALSNQREERISMTDARKVRWLLIYGTLQYLISAIQSPKEVRDTDGPDYFLCCLVAEQTPWHSGTRSSSISGFGSVNVHETIDDYLSESYQDITPGAASVSTIQPDCQTDGYFTHTNPDMTPLTRPISVEVPAPLRISAPVVRNSSIHSLRNLSVSAKSSRRNSMKGGKAHAPAFCEIIVHGFGNGLNEAMFDSPQSGLSRTQSIIPTGRSSNSNLPDGVGPETSWFRPSTPDNSAARRSAILGSFVRGQSQAAVVTATQVNQVATLPRASQHSKPPGSSGSAGSADSPFWSDGASASSKSSANDDHEAPMERKCSSAEASGLLGGLVSVDGSPITISQAMSHSLVVAPTAPCGDDFQFSFDHQFEALAEALLPVDDSPVSFLADSNIGVALSAPLAQPSCAPSTASSPSSTLNRIPPQPRSPLTKSLSADSLVPLAPLRMNPPTPKSNADSLKALYNTEPSDSVMDIFAALSLAPRLPDEIPRTDEVVGRSSAETSRSVDDAIPPPITKTAQIDMKKVVEQAERARKRERRMSFWRR